MVNTQLKENQKNHVTITIHFLIQININWITLNKIFDSDFNHEGLSIRNIELLEKYKFCKNNEKMIVCSICCEDFNEGEEIRKLKDELRDQQKKENEIEKTQRKQQEYLTVLEQKYREGCKKLGVSPSLNFTRAAKYDEIINLKSKSNQKLEINKSLSVEPKKKVIKPT